MNEVSNNPYEGREEMRPYPVTVECHPTGTPAAELPMGMVHEIAQVLAVHGCDLDAAGKAEPAVWAVVLMSLGDVLDAVPVEYGGRGVIDTDPEDGQR